MRQKRKNKTALAIIAPAPDATVFQARPDLASEAAAYASHARAANTVRAQESDWRVFKSWCEANNASPLPAHPEDVAAFLSERARDKATATVVRCAHTIAAAHEARGFPSPLGNTGVRKVLEGIKKTKGVRSKQKAAMTPELLERAFASAPETLQEVRDRALLLFGLATALRRSNIVAIDVEDLRWTENGAIVDVRRSKTDQTGEGAQVALPKLGEDNAALCPTRALRAWLDASGIREGAVFRGLRRNGAVRDSRLCDREVGRIAQRAAVAAGLDERAFGGHSLRAGYVTAARESGMDWATIMAQTGHKLLATVKKYSRYTPEIFEETRSADIFKQKLKKSQRTETEHGDRDRK